MRAALTILLVQEHGALREGLRLLLDHEGCRVVGATGDVAVGCTLAAEHRPDLALVDVGVGGDARAAAVRRIIDRAPNTAVVVYSGIGDAAAIRASLDAGARGYLLKQGTTAELMEALRAVAGGVSYVDPRLEGRTRRGPTSEAILSPREREILGLLAVGLTGEEAARRLFLSPETVRTHVRNAIEKLEASTRTHAVALALRRGEIGFD